VQSGNKPILWPLSGRPESDAPRLSHARIGQARQKTIPTNARCGSRMATSGASIFGADEPGAGTIKHLEFTKIAGGKPAVVAARNAWLGPDGRKMCEDQRVLHFDTDGDARWIDFDITIKATDGPVNFGDTKEGALASGWPTP